MGVEYCSVVDSEMKKEDVRAEAGELLLRAAAFCVSHSQLCNIHTVDFIVGKKWDLLPATLRQELDQLNFDQLQSLTDKDLPDFVTERRFPHLFHFIADAKAHSLEGLKICSSLSAISQSLPMKCVGRKSPYWCMSPKKCHEVEVLASVVSSLAADKGIKVVLDVGSGKGYLSSYLAVEHGLNVLAIDNSRSNTSGADERNKKVLYYRMRSHLKQNRTLAEDTSDTSCTSNSYRNHGSNSSVTGSQSASSDLKENKLPNSTEILHGTFVSRTHHVNSSLNLSCLIKDFISLLRVKNMNFLKNKICDFNKDIAAEGSQVLLCSLHGCGNLSASLLKLFVSTVQTKIVCSVGCCYHLIEEVFFRSLLPANDAKEVEEFGFPMSSALVRNKYQLGRNARMLASQSIDRISQKEKEPKRALFYRALLEVILRDKLGENSHVHTVGRIADRCPVFSMYVQKALKRLKLDHLHLSESELEGYMMKYSGEEKRLFALQQLRIIMAPCIEALILLDRLVFLLEQEVVQEAHLVRLFDPVTSPRCYGVIAWKRN